MELYKILVVKEDGRAFVDLYAGWFYDRVYYERISPTFKGTSYRTLFGSAIKVASIDDMKKDIAQRYLQDAR